LYVVFGAREAKALETTYYIHQDHLGSTSLVTDGQGTVISREVYYPYGETRFSSQKSVDGSQLTERKFTGQISDQDQTGLYYYNARYYNPQIAKFTQADSVNDQLNRYAYVGNNPIVFTDPTGNCSSENPELCTPNTLPRSSSSGLNQPIVPPYGYKIEGLATAGSSYWKEEHLSNFIIMDWYERALKGDYSEVPPMGFDTPKEMFEWERKFGLDALFERGLRSEQADYLLFQDFTNLSFQEQKELRIQESLEYQAFVNATLNKYPDLKIEYTNEFDTTDTAAAYKPDTRTIVMPFMTPENDMRLFKHELQHYIDIEVGGITNVVDTEINAHFRDRNDLSACSFDRWLAGDTLFRLYELRTWGLSDAWIYRLYLSSPKNFDNYSILTTNRTKR